MNTPIVDFLEKYTRENRLRLHMPGHKGEFPHDITEIEGADSLFESDATGGIIAQSEAIAAKIFGAAKTCYSCGGSTLAIQTALAVLKSQGVNTVAASRYSHRSLAAAAATLRLNVKWLYPREYLSADVEYTAQALSGADAVFIPNIDYYGGTWKFVKPNIPVIIDNAHGAYLRFVDKRKFGTEYLHPLELGFPLMSAESAHKTLPVLTGGAYLHFANGTDFSRAKEFMGIFGSSSPSYLIMESLDRFNGIIAANVNSVTHACEAVAALKAKLTKAGVPLRKSDPLRVVINARESGLSGFEYASVLRKNGVECEMADENRVVLLFSSATTVKDCERAEMAVLFAPQKKPLPEVKYPVIKPKADMPIYEALFLPQKLVPVQNAGGEVCAGMKAPCPPGVPLVMPGEIIDHYVVEALMQYGVKYIAVIDRSRS
ncbi:MAG: amino acid decarboxylase [Oscillospiraceae bacterium]